MKKYNDVLFPAVVFVLLSIILTGSFLLIEQQLIYRERDQYQYMAANQINIIKNGVDTSLARVYTFKAMVRNHQGDTSFFEKEAKEIYEETVEQTGIKLKNVAVAPGGVVEKVYPMIGNSVLIGFDFMDESRPGNAEAIAAYEKGSLVVTNPFELIQGGLGMGGRFPVFLKEDGKDVFWGLVTVTMDFEEVLKVFQLDSLTKMGASYELWYQNDDGERITLASSSKLPEHAVSHQFSIQNLTWYLDVAPQNGWNNYIRIVVVIAGILAISMLISVLLFNKAQIKRVNEHLEYVAHRDELTGCYSRQYVNTVLVDRSSGQWEKADKKYSLAILDIDQFKCVNDTYGHETGDKVIQAISRVLQQHIKEEKADCVIRHGGDEFVILYNDISKKHFRSKLQRIVEDVRDIRFMEYPDMKLSVSLGGVHHTDADGSLYYDMISQADKKLYKAKENGRDQYIV